MLENLIPILDGHSVNRSTITLYLPQEIIKPEKMLEKINKDDHFKSIYKRRNTINSKVFSIKNEKNEFSIIDDNNSDNVVGFILEEFDENGKLNNILVLKNEENKSTIGFETRKYIRWNNFFERFFTDFSKLVNDYEFYFEAMSLTYIDEFIWKSEERIPVEEIFEKNSELINSKFLKSKNGTIVLFSQNEDLNIEEKTEISFNNELKRIQIIHQYAIKFKNLYDGSVLIKNDTIKNLLDIAHLSNKETLKDLLTETVKKRINLN